MGSHLPEALPGPLPAPADPQRLEALANDLRAQGVAVLRSPGELAGLAADGFIYSPVLQPLLRGLGAQLGVRAQDPDQVLRVAAGCARHGVSLTLRGAGTGNYGQAVPLAGGLVLELSGLTRLRHLDPSTGVFTAEAAMPLLELEQQLQAQGREPRLLPSTVRSATLAGYVAGGSSGIGSLRWGFLRDPGHLLGLELVTLEPQPRLLQLDSAAANAINHAYGCNGIITALTMASAAAVPWIQLVLEFASWEQALAAAQRLPALALLLQSLCLLEAPVAALLPWPQGCPAATGQGHRLLLLAAPDALPVLESLLLDGAHNPPAAEALRRELDGAPDADNPTAPRRWLIAMQRHKDAPQLLQTLLRQGDQARMLALPEHPSWSAEELEAATGLPLQPAEADLPSNLHWLVASAALPVACGSLYLVAELLPLLDATD
ncbi:MAG: FAD-binding protein [Vulcanococcus sp.]